MRIPKHNTSKFECSPFYAGSILYNKLPKELKEEHCIKNFRNKIKIFLTENIEQFLTDTVVIK